MVKETDRDRASGETRGEAGAAASSSWLGASPPIHGGGGHLHSSIRRWSLQRMVVHIVNRADRDRTDRARCTASVSCSLSALVRWRHRAADATRDDDTDVGLVARKSKQVVARPERRAAIQSKSRVVRLGTGTKLHAYYVR